MKAKEELKLCECGCGESVTKPRNRFISEHNGRGKPRKDSTKRKISEIKRSGGRKLSDPILCECGCGQLTKPGNEFIKGHYIRTDHPMHHPGAVEKVRKFLTGRPGNKQSEEARRKNSEANSGEKNGFYGKHHTEKARKLMSELRKGEKSPGWLGGISALPYAFIWLSREFKEGIKTRDRYKCMNPSCWEVSKILMPHHIDYDKENCDSSNLITLCNSCNTRANRNRSRWMIFYRFIMSKCYGYKYGKSLTA